MQGARTARRGVVVLATVPALLALLCLPASSAQLDWGSSDTGGSIGSGAGHRLGATIGQGDANVSAAPGVVLVGGFWAIARARAATPMPTASATATASAAATASRTPTATATGTGGTPPTATPTTSPNATPTATPLPTTVAVSPTPTATVRPACIGDCNGDGQVRVEELVTLVNLALELQALDACPAGDRNGDGRVTIDEVLAAVNHALGSCPEEGGLR